MSLNFDEKSVTSSPRLDEVNSLILQAQVLHKKGDQDASELLYLNVLKLYPNHVEALQGLGLICFRTERYTQALQHLNQALDIAPDNASLFYDRAILFQTQGEYKVAIQNYNLTLFLDPYYTNAYLDRGLCFEALGEYDSAFKSYESALAVEPSFASAWYNKGNLLKTKGLFELAHHCYTVAIAINPDFWAAFTNNGLALYALKRYEEARANYDRAIDISPQTALIYYNKGNTLRSLGNLDLASLCYDKAIEINPKFTEAYANRGLIKKDQNQLIQAIDDYTTALSQTPDLLEAQWNLSIAQLMLGEWQKGWEGYELRFKHSELRQSVGAREFECPLWNGTQSLKDKKILIYCEQGLGDAIQFCRYLPLLIDTGAQVIFEVKPALKELFNSFKNSIEVIEENKYSSSFDYYSPLLSLAKAFQTNVNTVPPTFEIKIENAKLALWKERLNNRSKSLSRANVKHKRVGIVWSGNPLHTNDHNRSLDLQQLIYHLPKDFEYYVLQKEISTQDQIALSLQSHIISFPGQLNNLTDTAALCLQLDLIISVDTSVAHLSATLGKPTWILLPYCPDWRWLMDVAESPWYPSVRLIRQRVRGDWSSALEQVKRALFEF